MKRLLVLVLGSVLVLSIIVPEPNDAVIRQVLHFLKTGRFDHSTRSGDPVANNRP